MPPPLTNAALRRKIAAHRPATPAAPERDHAIAHVFGRALRRAGMPFAGLGLDLGQITVTTQQSLQDATRALPDQGLVAAIEDGQGRRGLLGLSPGLVDAMVEVQTTGRVEASPLPARPVTRIDEALCRDFIDLTLAAFAQEGQGIAARDWPEQMGYGSRIDDRGQINLLLPEGAHTVLLGAVGFHGVTRQASFALILPALAATDPKGRGEGRAPPDPAWLAARDQILHGLHLPLEVVLLRRRQALAQVQRLAVGDLIPFALADLHQVTLEDGQGRILLHGRLGQVGGRRALRFAAVPDSARRHLAASTEKAPPEDAPPASPGVGG